MASPTQPVTPSQSGIIERVKNNPIFTILAIAVGILYAAFPPAFLMSVVSLPLAAAISGVASALIAFTGLNLFHSLVEWLSPIMFPDSVVKHGNNDHQDDQDVSSYNGSANAIAALGGSSKASTKEHAADQAVITTAHDNQASTDKDKDQEVVRVTLV